MRRRWALAFLWAWAALAQPTAGSPPKPSRRVASAAAGTAVMVATAAAGILLGAQLPSRAFDASGRPQPWAYAGGVAVGSLTFALLSSWLVPEVMRLDPGGSPVAARLEGWRRSRWALVAAGLSTVALGVGAGLEQQRFGRGQVTMAASSLGVLVAMLSYGVLEVLGAHQGALQPP